MKKLLAYLFVWCQHSALANNSFGNSVHALVQTLSYRALSKLMLIFVVVQFTVQISSAQPIRLVILCPRIETVIVETLIAATVPKSQFACEQHIVIKRFNS